MRRSLPLLTLAAAALTFTAASPARADSSSPYVVVVAVALFDVASLPADIWMAASHERVPHDYAMAEAIGGGVQALAGGIGLAACGADPECKRGAAIPALGVFTAWTAVMAFHGVFSLGTEAHGSAWLQRPKQPSFALAPMIGDAHTTPAGFGIVGTF